MTKSDPKSKTRTSGPATKKAASRGTAKAAKAAKAGATMEANTQGSAQAPEQTAGEAAAHASTSAQGGNAPGPQRLNLGPRDREAMRAKLQAADFGNIVTILMQSPVHKDLPLSELSTLVVPAILHNQFSIAEAQNKKTGYTVPAAVALWACVSEEVEKRIIDNVDKPISLTAEEWNSGDKFWLVEILGDKRFIAPLLKRLTTTVFKDAPVKYRTMDDQGVASIKEFPTAKE